MEPSAPRPPLALLAAVYALAGAPISWLWISIRDLSFCGPVVERSTTVQDVLSWSAAVAIAGAVPTAVVVGARPLTVPGRVALGMLGSGLAAALYVHVEPILPGAPATTLDARISASALFSVVVAVLGLVPALVVELALALQRRARG